MRRRLVWGFTVLLLASPLLLPSPRGFASPRVGLPKSANARPHVLAPTPKPGVSPASVSSQPGTVELFDETSGGIIEHSSWTNAVGWSSSESLGGTPASGPA